MDYAASGSRIIVNLGIDRTWDRHTCLRSDSIITSFCFNCARRYSRLLTGKDEYSSSSEEVEGEGEGARDGVGSISNEGV
jgi:hypothetical protein